MVLIQMYGGGWRPAKNPTQQGGYVETKQPTYPREGRCVGRCVEDTGSLDWWYEVSYLLL